MNELTYKNEDLLASNEKLNEKSKQSLSSFDETSKNLLEEKEF